MVKDLIDVHLNRWTFEPLKKCDAIANTLMLCLCDHNWFPRQGEQLGALGIPSLWRKGSRPTSPNISGGLLLSLEIHIKFTFRNIIQHKEIKSKPVSLSRWSRTAWPRRLVCSPMTSWSASLVGRSTRWPMTRSIVFNHNKNSQSKRWIMGRAGQISCFQAERAIQKAGDRFTMVIERWVRRGRKVVKGKRVSDELPVTCTTAG